MRRVCLLSWAPPPPHVTSGPPAELYLYVVCVIFPVLFVVYMGDEGVEGWGGEVLVFLQTVNVKCFHQLGWGGLSFFLSSDILF